MNQTIQVRESTLPSSLNQVGIITRYELLNYFRSRRFYVLLTIAILISAVLTGLVAYYRTASFTSSSIGFYSSWWGMSASFIIILSGIFFGGDAISGEFQNKTGYFLVGNPLRRSSIYTGKWIAALIASLIVLGIFAGITVGNGLYYFGLNIPYQFGESFLFSVLYLVAVLGLTFFFSSVFKSSSISILVTVILLLVAFTIIQTFIQLLAQIEPWFLISYGAEIIGNVLSDPYPAHVTTSHLAGPRSAVFTSYNVTVPEGVAILLAYFVVTAILGLVIFERKEFN